MLSLEKIDFLSASAFLFLFGIGLISYIIITSIFLFKTADGNAYFELADVIF